MNKTLCLLIGLSLSITGCANGRLHINQQSISDICANAQIVGTSVSQISQVFADAGVEQTRANQLAQKASLATNIAATVCAILEQIRFEQETANPDQNANEPVV